MTAFIITREQALKIRERYMHPNGGTSITTIAAEFGVSSSLISSVIRGVHPFTLGLENLHGKRPKQVFPVTPSVRPRWRAVHGASPARRAADRLSVACPKCGAPPRERCHVVNSGTYPRSTSMHRERQA